MTSFGLKLIALLTMAVDHTGAVLFPGELWMRILGRVSFPIYCFLLAEGLYHTKNLGRYLWRLGVFAILSEIPYDLAFHRAVWYPYSQNIFFTLFLGLLGGAALQRLQKAHPVGAVVASAACAFAAEFLRTDYGALGVCFILIFVFFRWRPAACSCFTVLNTVDSLGAVGVQLFAPMAVVPILLYNGEKGRTLPKYVFYAFYPIHLLLLALLSHFTV